MNNNIRSKIEMNVLPHVEHLVGQLNIIDYAENYNIPEVSQETRDLHRSLAIERFVRALKSVPGFSKKI